MVTMQGQIDSILSGALCGGSDTHSLWSLKKHVSARDGLLEASCDECGYQITVEWSYDDDQDE